MLSYIHRNLVKNTVNFSIHARQLGILKPGSFSENVRADIIERRYKSVVSIFEGYGFTESQLSGLLAKRPLLLSYNKEKQLKPKLEFFTKNGFSSSDICCILSLDPDIMRRSSEDLIIPSYEFLKSILKDNGTIIAAVRRCTWLLKQDLQKNLRPNVELLRNYGVPEVRILGTLKIHPRTFMQNADRFKTIVEEVKEMGFEPEKSQFVQAIQVRSGLCKSVWERKWDHLKKWGWSDDEIRAAFLKQPHFMAVSEKKVKRVMDFLINNMGWEVSKVSCCPSVVMHSFEKWTLPRCLVIQFLWSKGVVSKHMPLNTIIVSLEGRFVENYVNKYCAEFPEVLKLYASPQDNAEAT